MSDHVTSKEPLRFETIGVHTGLKRSENEINDAAIYASTSFCFNDSAHGAAIFNGTAEAFCYSRIGNPTLSVFDQRMAALEGGAAALATASGQAALFIAITALAKSGNNIVVASSVSNTSEHAFKYRLPPLGITAQFVSTYSIDQVRGAINESTQAIFVESISDVDLRVADIEALAEVAHAAGIPLVVDNTAGAGGYLIRPIDHGADIVIASATEWLSISGSNQAGIIIDSGSFDWSKSKDRFPQFFEPSPGFHGLRLWEKFGNLSYITFARAAIMRDIGPCLNPFEASLLIAGLETLSVRIERISSNALKLASWLDGSNVENIDWVHYPALPTVSTAILGQKYLKRGAGGVLSFKLLDSRRLDLNKLEVVSAGHIVGGSRTKIIPGICDEFFVSVGLENIDDIIADFKQVFAAASRNEQENIQVEKDTINKIAIRNVSES